jgi:CBS domain-containing protein
MSTQNPATAPLAQRLARTTVREAMQLGLFTCAPDDPVETVARTMAQQSIHGVVVMGIARRGHGGEHLGWGIVSALDLMAALDPDAEGSTAGDVAGTEVVTVSPREPLGLAAQLMTEHQTAHVVVVSPETGRPVGMVSALDVARVAGGD